MASGNTHRLGARIGALAILLTVAAVAAGCGSSNSAAPATPADWASGVCSAVGTWKASLQTAVDPLKSGDISKDSLQTAADSAKSATETLQSSLKDLGKPNTQAGQQATDAVDQLESELKADADTIKSAIDGATGVSGVASAVTTITATVATMKTQVSATVTTLKQVDAKGELTTAFQQSGSCQQLSGGS